MISTNEYFLSDDDVESGALRQGDIIGSVQLLGAISYGEIAHLTKPGQSPNAWNVARAPEFGDAMIMSHDSPPRVAELASRLGMSRFAFTRHFKLLCGEPPSSALKRAHLLRAEELLPQVGNVTLTAYAAAYGTRRTMLRSFRRLLLCRPTETLILRDRSMPPSPGGEQSTRTSGSAE